MTELAADDIDETFVPRPRAEVSFVEVDDELVVAAPVGPFASDAHWLDRTASIVWNAFDGVTSLGELVDDLAAAFGADRDLVRDDVLELTRTLGRAGLLDGVAYVAPAAVHPLRPEGLPVGTALPAFTRRDLDGAFVRNEDLTGARWCVVNWSPSCGYCVNIAAELAELVPALADVGVALVLFATGPADENRQLLAHAGLRARVLLDGRPPRSNPRSTPPNRRRHGEAGLFTGIGTPSAYLVDAEGAVATELAYGAVECPHSCASSSHARNRDCRARPAPGARRGRGTSPPGAAGADHARRHDVRGASRRGGRERITGHLDRALDAGWLRASDEQRDDALRRHEAMLSVDLILERLLVDTSRLLTYAGIRHLALKGPVVARTAYPDPALRSFGDVDILVDGARFDAAVAHLERAAGTPATATASQLHRALREGRVRRHPDGLEIDLHRVFVAGPFGLAIDPADLFVAAEAIEIGAAPFPRRTRTCVSSTPATTSRSPVHA